MKPFEAIEQLSDGHNILAVATAEKVCEAVDVPFSEKLIMQWETAEEALQKLGFFATVAPGSGVDSLDLSYYVARQLGIDPAPGRGFSGKGYQAKANGRAIAQKLSLAGNL